MPAASRSIRNEPSEGTPASFSLIGRDGQLADVAVSGATEAAAEARRADRVIHDGDRSDRIRRQCARRYRAISKHLSTGIPVLRRKSARTRGGLRRRPDTDEPLEPVLNQVVAELRASSRIFQPHWPGWSAG